MAVLLETTIGDIVVDLFTEERPTTCLNFLKLCKIKYYNYCLIHTVERNFIAQTGDATGTGRGGESVFRVLYGDQAKFFDAEVKPRLKHKKKGTISMVNNGNNMHGSQFFLTLGEDLDYLDGVHTVFGEVSEGEDILDKLNEIICDDDHKPYQDIRINHTVILDDPFDDPPDLPIPDRSPEPTKQQLESGRIGADEEIDDTKGKTDEEINKMVADRELKAGTQILEMIGDIPDADVKPPDNVLFVCKLNPVTTDEDLEIIFSRFGPIKSCEVIRELKTGESLQYAFIEFENEDDCEKAYFKMDNVLIDDRRIHVDFSQSVAKIKSQKPGAKPVYELLKKGEKKPMFEIKDKSSKNKYDLVLEGDSEEDEPQTKKKKRQEGESSSDENRKDKKKKKKKRRYSDDEDEGKHKDSKITKSSYYEETRERKQEKSHSSRDRREERYDNERKYNSKDRGRDKYRDDERRLPDGGKQRDSEGGRHTHRDRHSEKTKDKERQHRDSHKDRERHRDRDSERRR